MMKFPPTLFFTTIVTATMALVGCSENTPVQTVDWYKAHETERRAMIAKCDDNPGELGASPSCINATTAANHIAVDKRGYPKLEFVNPWLKKVN